MKYICPDGCVCDSREDTRNGESAWKIANVEVLTMKAGLNVCFLLELEVGSGDLVCIFPRELLVRQSQPANRAILSVSWLESK